MPTNKTLILLVILAGICQLTLVQSCYGDYRVYYAKTLLYLHQNIDSGSAKVGEALKRNNVKFTSGSFGSTIGFWTVFCKNKSGYANKNHLSNTTVSSATYKPICTSKENNLGINKMLVLTYF